jgi:heme/copper-type cytochrome/quinol oxidase subunit 3
VVSPDHPALAPAPGGLPIGWWGLAWLVATEAMLFGGLLSAWFFTRAGSRAWPQGGIAPPELGRISVFTVVLVSSSLPLLWGEAAIRRGHVGRLRVALAVSFVLGAAFLANQVVDYRDLTFGIRDNAYASLFYVTTGLHGLHVAVGLAVSLAVQVKVAAGRIDAEHHLSVRVFGLYWHFVDVVWIAVFGSLYLSTHLR